MKQRIRLTEGDLHRIIKESVREVLNEGDDTKSNFDGDVYKCVTNALISAFGKEQVNSLGTGIIVTNPQSPDMKLKITIDNAATQNITGFNQTPFNGMNAQSGFQRTPFNNK